MFKMAGTRFQTAQLILHEVFDFAPPLERALSAVAYMDVRRWLTLGDDELKTLTYLDNEGQQTLKLGHIHKLRVYRTFVQHQQANSMPATCDGSDVTQDVFETFMISNECICLMTLHQPQRAIPTPAPLSEDEQSVVSEESNDNDEWSLASSTNDESCIDFNDATSSANDGSCIADE
jgi:hypothetical protein